MPGVFEIHECTVEQANRRATTEASRIVRGGLAITRLARNARLMLPDVSELVAAWKAASPPEQVALLLQLSRRKSDLSDEELDLVEEAMNALKKSKGGEAAVTTRERSVVVQKRKDYLSQLERDAQRITELTDALDRARLLRSRDPEAALVLATRATEIDRLDPAVWATLASCLRPLQRPREALAAARQSLGLNADVTTNAPGYNTGAAAALEARELEEAVGYAERLETTKPTELPTLRLLLKVFSAGGKRESFDAVEKRAQEHGHLKIPMDSPAERLAVLVSFLKMAGQREAAENLKLFLTDHGGIPRTISTKPE